MKQGDSLCRECRGIWIQSFPSSYEERSWILSETDGVTTSQNFSSNYQKISKVYFLNVKLLFFVCEHSDAENELGMVT